MNILSPNLSLLTLHYTLNGQIYLRPSAFLPPQSFPGILNIAFATSGSVVAKSRITVSLFSTYDAANGGKLSFKAIDRPIVIRFLGTVTTPEGLTAYNDTKEGGGVGIPIASSGYSVKVRFLTSKLVPCPLVASVPIT
mgnify:CR=1 FL=1